MRKCACGFSFVLMLTKSDSSVSDGGRGPLWFLNVDFHLRNNGFTAWHFHASAKMETSFYHYFLFGKHLFTCNEKREKNNVKISL